MDSRGVGPPRSDEKVRGDGEGRAANRRASLGSFWRGGEADGEVVDDGVEAGNEEHGDGGGEDESEDDGLGHRGEELFLAGGGVGEAPESADGGGGGQENGAETVASADQDRMPA